MPKVPSNQTLCGTAVVNVLAVGVVEPAGRVTRTPCVPLVPTATAPCVAVAERPYSVTAGFEKTLDQASCVFLCSTVAFPPTTKSSPLATKPPRK